MSKFKPVSGFTTPVKIQALNFSFNALRSPTMYKAPTNYAKPNTTFTPMNAVVISLDAIFRGFLPSAPPPIPNKAEWDTAAAQQPHFHVCGCYKETLTGQKLFRVINYFNYIMGTPMIDRPPDMSGYIYAGWLDATREPAHGPDPRVIRWRSGNPAYAVFGILQLGHGLNNPVLHYTPATGDPIWHDGDPYFQQVWDLPIPAQKYVCPFDNFGRPGDPAMLNIFMG